MAEYPRYALYYVPSQDTDLYRFGSRIIGYDSFDGASVSFEPSLLHTHPDWSDLTSDPRKYGLHATLKAPFFLRAGLSETDLRAALEQFARKSRPVPVIAPTVKLVQHFIAIVPSEPNAELNALAADCVEVFDDFRAPLTPQDRARRNPDALTPSQRAHLDRWGYPYVMDDFRFHMTLTGSLKPEQAAIVLPELQRLFALLNVETQAIDRVVLLKQDSGQSRFKVIAACALGDTAVMPA